MGREEINYQQKSILQQNTNFNYLRFSSHALSLSHSLTLAPHRRCKNVNENENLRISCCCTLHSSINYDL